jgi:hypothetical protein
MTATVSKSFTRSGFVLDGAAQESNLPSVGLRRRTGFEDRHVNDTVAGESGIGAGVLAVEPAPLSFKSFLLLLHTAATDPEVRLEPYEEQLIDAGAFRTEHGGVAYEVRPAGSRPVEVRRKLDYGDRLVHVTPDLRSVVRVRLPVGR